MRCARESRVVWTDPTAPSKTLRTQLQTHSDGRLIERGQPHRNRPRTYGRVRYSSGEAREIRPPQTWRRVGGCMVGGAMTAPLLVRHSAPFPTESLFGYILRLSEENGYTTPWSLFLLAQIRQHEARSPAFREPKDCFTSSSVVITLPPPSEISAVMSVFTAGGMSSMISTPVSSNWNRSDWV